MSATPTPEQLQSAWEELQKFHKNQFEKDGVKIPQGEKYTNSAKSCWLSILYFHRDECPIHKDYIAKIVQREMPEKKGDQQVRHLKADGWDIGDIPGRHKLNLKKPLEQFLNSPKNRRSTLPKDDWKSLLCAYNYTCATCGAKEGEKHRFYGGQVVQLQKGHKDPLGAGDDMDNIIPQCQYCNRAYRNHYEFDDKGRVRAVASVKPVEKSNEKVKAKIWKYLKEFFKLFI